MSHDEKRQAARQDDGTSQQLKRPRTRKRATTLQISEFSQAEAVARASGFNLDFLNPVGLEPELTEAVKALAPAITASVNQGNQHGAAFLAKVIGSNPNRAEKLSDADKQSVVDRHNWEAGRRPKRQKLNRNKTSTKVTESLPDATGAPSTSGPAERPASSEERPSKPDAIQSSGGPAPRAQSAEGRNVFIPSGADEPDINSPAEPVRKLPQVPKKVPFYWSKDGEKLANAFFGSIFREQALSDIRNAAIALKSDSVALANVRSRGAAVSKYLDEAFRDLGII